MKPRLPASERWTTYYLPTPLDDALMAECTLFAIHVFEAARLHDRLVRGNSVMDEDVLTLLGFALAREGRGGTPALLRKALAWQRDQLQEMLRRHRCRQIENLRKLCEFLHFDEAEQAATYLSLMLSQSNSFRDILRIGGCLGSVQKMLVVFSRPFGVGASQLRQVLKTGSRPVRMGLIQVDFFDADELPTVPDPIRFALETDDFDTQAFLRRLVRCAPPPRLAVSDFSHLAQLPILQRYLQRASVQSLRGVNILLYGTPGTGKTELARALAGDAGAELFEVPNESNEGKAISGTDRFSAFSLCQQVLEERARPMVPFDEAEDVFEPVPTWSPSGRDARSARGKSWINELLESNAAPTIWTCNTIGGFDAAYLRRFDMVVEMRTPPRSARRRIVDHYFASGEISAACADRLASADAITPAVIERAARVVHAVEVEGIAERDATAVRLVEDTLRAMGATPRLPAAELPAHYDPAFFNADRDLATLAERLRKHPHIRMCLYGPPGTGKTAFAHHLGRMLDIPVIVRRGSDLLGMYVGESEARIAAAFQGAHDDGAILVIDEADGFLRDRAGADRSWEVTQVNELLTQMEAFDGILIASTNLMGSLDAAALRRFDIKTKFDYMKPTQRSALLASVCGVDQEILGAGIVRALDRLEQLTPGDFANALRQLDVTQEAATPARVLELIAAEVALKPEARHRAIGFVN
jgi:SpoVK/Ycf46/Vps4 family AAA+-type ATPase